VDKPLKFKIEKKEKKPNENISNIEINCDPLESKR
jgi:hypothetical protein